MFAVNVVREQDPVSIAIVNQWFHLLYLLSIAWKVNSIVPLLLYCREDTITVTCENFSVQF